MKLYQTHADASISMKSSVSLPPLLRELMRREQITDVVETGTHHGLGSTTLVAEAFPPDGLPRSFVTIEANWRSWRTARRNLARFPFVTPVWGHSLRVKEAIRFVRGDDALLQHDRYPDIYVDELTDPVSLYENELRGRLGGRILRHPLAYVADRLRGRHSGENLLARSLSRVRDARPLVVLDSAGGTGLLEFATTRETLRGRAYFVLLDDVHHVKHFRSLAHIRSDAEFTILGLNEREGWALAEHHAGHRTADRSEASNAG
jgi:hypothetical protein